MDRTINISTISLLIAIVSFGLPISYPFAIGDFVVIICISLLVLLSVVLATNKKSNAYIRKDKDYKKVEFAFGMYGSWMILAFLFGSIDLTSVIRLVQFAGCFSAFYLAANYSFRNNHFALAHNLIKISLLICLIDWVTIGRPIYNYAFIFGNPNTFSSVLLCWFIVLSLRRKKKIIDILFGALILFFIFISTSRAALLSVLIYMLLVAIFRMIEGERGIIRKEIVNMIFVVEAVVLIAFIVIYAGLLELDIGEKLQSFSQLYFHKNFFSGRQLVWSSLLPFIKAKPILGYGLSTVPSAIVPNIHYSGHNTFFQIAIQMGIIGSILLLLIIRNIICVCASNQTNYMRVNIMAFTFVILFHECFEVCLTQNMMACGLIMWFVMGLGCNNSIRMDE